MPTSRREWHHIILTTYGSWLYGDPRGFRTRHHREHVEGDYKSPPPPGLYESTAARSHRSLKEPPVVFPAEMREVVGRALWQAFTRRGAWLLIVAVGGQHAHLLVKLPRQQQRTWTGLAKRYSSVKLRESGWEHRVWSIGSKSILVRNQTQQRNTFRYIERHSETGAWVGVWKHEGRDA